jgi:AAA domain-containing protein/uncharacterized protein DUF4011
MTIQPLVDLARERGGLEPDSLIECLAPLFRQVIACHAEGMVAPLRGVDALNADDRYRVRFDPGLAHPPLLAPARVEAVQSTAPTALEVVGRSRLTHDLFDRREEVRSLDVLHPPVPPEAVERPVLVSGWQTWEHVVGHHDELTDLASLGLLLAALALGLDLGLVADADDLARHRGNLFALRPGLHPVIGQLIGQLIAPDRHARLQDLPTALQRLENYRDQPVDFSLATVGSESRSYRTAVLETLRDRLFDLTRRNRLLHFRPTQQSLNLTEASVPLLLDARNVRPDQLCTWSPRTARKVLRGNGLSLGSVVRWADAPYAAGTLDGLIAQARRDLSEYGRSSVRLIVAFFRWHDVKSAPEERIASPLLLLPVSLTKRRGVRDSYVLKAGDSVAEVNPALRQQLDQLYGIDLPESVDLADDDAIAGLHRILAGQIAAGEPGVTLTIRERPRIELVHRQAKLRFDAFQRRTGRAHTAIGGRTYAYSYRHRDFRPLGLQIFRDRVAPQPSPTAVLLGADPQPHTMVDTVERETFVLDDGSAGNRYAWEIDLCAVTLAALNYRTMSLVSDYRSLIADDTARCPAFDQIFSAEPRRIDDFGEPALPLAERHVVVPADSSQVAAIARARSGESFVIQGPPGTGKSQTITNLIADYVFHGRRVLFVCQKRAALDVVHARLRSRGLAELTCLIHDSQTDKKEFVTGLRASYESWLQAGDDVERAERRREGLIAGIEGDLAEMRRYEGVLDAPVAVVGPPDEGAPTLRWQIARLLELSEHRWGDLLAPEQARWLPSPAEWESARPAVTALREALATVSPRPGRNDAAGALGALAPEVLREPRPAAAVAARAGAALAALTAVVDVLDDPELSVDSAARVVSFAARALPLTERGLGGALRRGREVSRRLDAEVTAYRKAVTVAEAAAAAASGWSPPLPDATEARQALAVARNQETSFWRFLSGDWRRVKALVAQRYQGPSGATAALELLVAAQTAEATAEQLRAAVEQEWGFAAPPELATFVSAARKESDPRVVPVRDALASADPAAAAELGERLADAAPLVTALQTALTGLVSDVGDLPLPVLAALLEELADPQTAAGVRAVARPLLTLHEHPPVLRALRRLEATPAQIEYAICATSLAEACADDPRFAGFDGARLAALVGRIQRGLPRLHQAEAELVVSRVRSAFLAQARHAQRSVTGMSPGDRARKQTWSAGRRILEHEFGKVQRYKSIRDLSSGESGAVVAALRPVWLMSPASVSDTLPLDPGLFDVVIYDEASQIPVEEAVPAMHRAGQVIVVGDRMQLPPTQYFSTRSPSSEDAPGPPDDEDDDEIGVVLDGDSFLAQCAVRLPSSMLTWHYRSRFEALIAFSNAMFYGGRLAAVPDRAPAAGPRPELVVDSSALREAAVAGVDGLLGRSVSFHRTPESVYRRRVNPGEAAYVAELVREFLARGTGLTLGVVAFSQPQQGEIERALEELARTDDIFARRFEEELNRKDGEQAVGLFVKNLENVQGDERDVMIMSVCYAPGPTGRMLMNFGPINTHGGEKRLNVIVSRARQHMAVVSSIEPTAITNTYNDGAATLRRFLAYAQAVSRGDTAGAGAVLTGPGSPLAITRREPAPGLLPGRRPAPVPSAHSAHSSHSVAGDLATSLRERGLVVEVDLGQSAFRCDLAVRRPESPDWQVAVLLDTPARVDAQPLAERMTSHPAVLAATGWRVVHVLTRDWLETPGHVLDTVSGATLTAEGA